MYVDSVFHGFKTLECQMGSREEVSYDFLPVVYKFASDISQNIPIHVRTGRKNLGLPFVRKRFNCVEFYGVGSIHFRVYIDGAFIHESSAVMSEHPNKFRKIGLPSGTKGYDIDIEFAGDAEIRAIKHIFTPLDGNQ